MSKQYFMHDDLRKTIEFSTEEFIETFEVPDWALDAETLGDVNVKILRLLRPIVEKTMDSRPTHEVRIVPRIFVKEDRESTTVERF